MRNTKKCLVAVLSLACISTFTVGALAVSADTVTPKTVDEVAITMESGASVRKAQTYADLGIRYSFTMTEADYTALMANKGADGVYSSISYGVFVAPKSYYDIHKIDNETELLQYYCWNGEESGKEEILNTTSTVMVEDEEKANTRVFHGAVVNMLPENLLTEYIGIGYVKYTTNATETKASETHYRFIAQNDNVRSMVYVAQKAIEDNEDENGLLATSYLTETVKMQASSYNVEYWLQQADGTYKLDESNSTTVEAKVGASAELDVIEIDGYVYDEDNENEVLSGTVYANGKLTLKAYYSKDYGFSSTRSADKIEFATYNEEEGIMLTIAGSHGAGTIATSTNVVDILSMDRTTSLVKFLPKNYTGAFLTANGYMWLQVKIVDVEDSTNVITVNYGDAKNGTQALFKIDYKGAVYQHNQYMSLDGAWGSAYYELKFNGKTKTLSYGQGTCVLYGTDLPMLTGFENGAYITFSSNGWINSNQEIFVTELGGYKVENGALVKMENPVKNELTVAEAFTAVHEAAKVSAGANGVEISGVQRTTWATYNQTIDMCSYQGETLLKFKPTAGTNWADLFICLTDVKTGKALQIWLDTRASSTAAANCWIAVDGSIKSSTAEDTNYVWGVLKDLKTEYTITYNHSTKTITVCGDINEAKDFKGVRVFDVSAYAPKFSEGATLSIKRNWASATEESMSVTEIDGYTYQNGVLVKA